MKKKNIIVSGLFISLVVLWWTYFTLANDDQTCYSYSSSNSCSIDKSNCTDWINSKRTCYGTKTTTYTRWSDYSCSSSWWNIETRKTYSTKWTCAEEFVDTSAPTISEAWIK
jgi:hypothetical protein